MDEYRYQQPRQAKKLDAECRRIAATQISNRMQMIGFDGGKNEFHRSTSIRILGANQRMSHQLARLQRICGKRMFDIAAQ